MERNAARPAPPARLRVFENLDDPASYAMWWLLFYAFGMTCYLAVKAFAPPFFSDLQEPMFTESLFASIQWAAGTMWFLAWQFSLRQNYSYLGIQGLGHSKWEGLAWWFVPLANLVMPFLVLQELWQAGTPPESDDPDPEAWKQQRWSALILVYWMICIGGLVPALLFIRRMATPDDAPLDPQLNTWLSSKLDSLLIVRNIAQRLLEILIIQRLTRRQEALRRRLLDHLQCPPVREAPITSAANPE